MQKKILSQKIMVSLPKSIVFNTEISQERAPTSTSRLWIQDDGTIFKQYVVYNELTEHSIDNLLRIASNKKLYRISELSMPIAIYESNGKIIGYLMEYHNMESLAYYFNGKKHSLVLMAFRHLAALINKLPRGIYIGDLHAGNVLVNEYGIRVIDIDGFSLKNGYKLCCPLKSYSEHNIFLHKKYRDRAGNFCVSKDSDIACVLWLFLSYLMGADPFCYTEDELRHYFLFLKGLGLPQDLYDMLNCMMSPKRNYLVPSVFEKVPLQMLNYCSYKEYVKNSSLAKLICTQNPGHIFMN